MPVAHPFGTNLRQREGVRSGDFLLFFKIKCVARISPPCRFPKGKGACLPGREWLHRFDGDEVVPPHGQLQGIDG